jgi:NAD(P)-dependent dehydrogenase (short-subunit alcohol dehydrogenase family)
MSTDRIAVVTGASAGVGRATAVALAREGFDVALLARGDAGLEAAAEDVRREGRRALPLPTDVADVDAVERAASRAEDELGPLTAWVNDAMTTVFAPATEMAPQDFKRAIEVTFLGQVWGTLAALKRMRPRDEGTIVNVGSALAFIGIPLQAAYCSSKFACRGFYESVRAELLHEGSHVRLTMVHLPAVNTPQFDWCKTTLPRHPQPVPPIYQPEVPAAAIAEAVVTGRPSRVVGSWNKLLVAGAQVAPNFGNHYAAVGAWDAQMTDEPISADRPVDLYTPADRERAYGAHGRFDSRARGVRDPSFLKSLPTVASNFVVAVRGASRDAVHARRAAAAWRARHREEVAAPDEREAPSLSQARAG